MRKITYAFALLFAIPLAGCSNIKPSITKDVSSTHPALQALLDGPGGPRLISEFEAGKITEELEPKYKDLIPGYVIVRGERVQENSVVTRGTRVTIVGVAASQNDQKNNQVGNFILGEQESKDFSSAMRAALQYVKSHASSPPQGQQYLQWQSKEGLRVVAGFTDGNAGIAIAAKDDSPIIELTPTLAEQLADKVDGAFAMTK